jgi:hypothetical protein
MVSEIDTAQINEKEGTLWRITRSILKNSKIWKIWNCPQAADLDAFAHGKQKSRGKFPKNR